MRGQIYRYTNDNRKENLGRSEIKRRKENTLCRHGEIQLTSKRKKKNRTLNKEKSFQDSKTANSNYPKSHFKEDISKEDLINEFPNVF